jgi:hypothetical protein
MGLPVKMAWPAGQKKRYLPVRANFAKFDASTHKMTVTR